MQRFIIRMFDMFWWLLHWWNTLPGLRPDLCNMQRSIIIWMFDMFLRWPSSILVWAMSLWWWLHWVLTIPPLLKSSPGHSFLRNAPNPAAVSAYGLRYCNDHMTNEFIINIVLEGCRIGVIFKVLDNQKRHCIEKKRFRERAFGNKLIDPRPSKEIYNEVE